MKKTLFITIILGAIILMSASLPGDIDKSIAKVKQEKGMYVFAGCEPIAEYEYLGTIKGMGVMSNGFNDVKNRLVSKARKKYKEADGIILHFANGPTELDKADVIKFK